MAFVKRKKTRPNKRAAVLIVVGVFLVALAALAIWQQRQAAEEGAALPDPMATVMSSPRDPSEASLPKVIDFKVPSDQPRSISLPTISAQGFVQRVGLDQDNTVVAPTNINFAGWYVAEAKPGDTGVSLIDGHVQGRYKPGIFKNLSQLKSGDSFAVEYGDRSWRQFEVVSVTSYPREEAAEHMLAQDPSIGRQLNLVTCDGNFDQQRETYRNRLVVVSKYVESGSR